MSYGVSIITLTKLTSSIYLKVLLEIIKTQSYKNIIEWLIIESSIKKEETENNEKIIDELIHSEKKLKIKYIPYQENKNNNQLRNHANNIANGEIIVNLEENDYYFKNCVETRVGRLIKGYNIICSNNYYIYDLYLNKTFISKNNPSSSGLTYFKSYIITHCLDDNEDINENIKNVSNIDYLPLELSQVQIIHKFNLFFKRYNSIMTLMGKSNNWINLMDEVIEEFILDKHLKIYKKLINNDYLDFDIVYYTGLSGIIWDPENLKLGGSEQAVVHLSKNWVKNNKKVVVYGNFPNNKNIDGVEYVHYVNFPFEKKIKNLIIWRSSGIMSLMNINFNADNVLLDLHDNFSYTLAKLNKNNLLPFLKKVSKYMFKSNYHLECFEEFINEKLPNDKYDIILNGVRINEFYSNNYENRNPYRFCYCSSYDRGLETILEKLWPIIINKEPRAELHIYYGMDYLYDVKFKNKLKNLMNQPGVYEYGRQPIDIITKEKQTSTYHLYLTNVDAEIDCISIKESIIAGCIPIISNFGVFKERNGIKYDWNPNDDLSCKNIANDLLIKINDQNYINCIRNELINIKYLNWNETSKAWLNNFI